MKRSNYNVKTKLVLCDRSHDSKENFRYLQEKRIAFAIKVRKNSITSSKTIRQWNREVLILQTRDFVNGKRKQIMENDGL